MLFRKPSPIFYADAMKSFEPDPDDSLDEYPDPENQGDSADLDPADGQQICPHCGKIVYADTEDCQGCGFFLTDETESPEVSGYPTWRWLIIGLLLIVFLGGFYFLR